MRCDFFKPNKTFSPNGKRETIIGGVTQDVLRHNIYLAKIYLHINLKKYSQSCCELEKLKRSVGKVQAWFTRDSWYRVYYVI